MGDGGSRGAEPRSSSLERGWRRLDEGGYRLAERRWVLRRAGRDGSRTPGILPEGCPGYGGLCGGEPSAIRRNAADAGWMKAAAVWRSGGGYCGGRAEMALAP
jgi:hypothetical protein